MSEEIEAETVKYVDVEAEWKETSSGYKATAGPLTLVFSDGHIHHPESIVGSVRPLEDTMRQIQAQTVEEAKAEMEKKAVEYLYSALGDLII
jgi:hypothetical protein